MNEIKSQFPILQRQVNGKKLVYLDNAASSQKPKRVLDAIENYYKNFNANVHRGIHTISQEATDLMENSRKAVQQFINAKHDYEIIFTKGTTDAINLVAFGIEPIIKKGDEIIVSQLEHHSNIVPWQMLAERTGAKIIMLPFDENCELKISELQNLLNEKTKLLAVNHISNALGVVNPIKEIIEICHKNNTLVLVDGAQAIPHKKIDVQELDADFYCFSGHKMYAPTGVGILYGKEKHLNQMRPYQGGGEMIKEVSFSGTTYAELPFKFEAGTPNIEANIVLHEAIKFISDIGFNAIQTSEKIILNELTMQLSALPEIIIYAKNAKERAGAVSFNLNINGIHASDVGMILDKQGIAVRTGHHCCQPIMQQLNINGTVRASFGIYNDLEDITSLISGLKMAIMMLK